MIVLQANEKMKAIYLRTISIMDQNVEWNGTFMISNNTLILPGKLKSLFLNIDSKYAMGAVIEEDIKEKARDMKDNVTLESAINMLLYIFGKWGKIKGLVVDKSFEQLTDLINGILSDINITSKVTADNCQFFMNGIQVTYEDVIEKLYAYLVDGKEFEDEINEDNKLLKSDKDNPEEQTDNIENRMHKMGLWHKLVWQYETKTFQKNEVSAIDRNLKRLGNGFYLSNYICSDCINPLFMAVYSADNEFEIDTDKGKIITTRNYACPECHKYFTAFPYKMLSDGEVFVMDFEDDETAFEDYLELVGSDGSKNMNCGFNRFVDEELNRKYTEEDNPAEVWKRRVYDLFETDLEEMTDEEIEEIKDIYDEKMLPVNMGEQSLIEYVDEIDRQRKKRNITYNSRGILDNSNKKYFKDKKATDNEGQGSKKSENKGLVNKEPGRNIVDKNEATKNPINKVDSTKNKPFISRRSKVQVARRILDSGNTSDFTKYVENMDEDDLSEFIMEMDSKANGKNSGTTSSDSGQASTNKDAVQTDKDEFYKIAKEKLVKTQQKNILDMAMEAKWNLYIMVV